MISLRLAREAKADVEVGRVHGRRRTEEVADAEEKAGVVLHEEICSPRR